MKTGVAVLAPSERQEALVGTGPHRSPAARERGGQLQAFAELAKPRLNLLVVASALAGYVMGGGEAAKVALLWLLAGTGLVAGGASAFNQVIERQADALMRRTRLRPLPDGRLGVRESTMFGAAITVAGLFMLWAGVNLLAMLVALATLVTYAALYTPLKPRTSFATVVGAVPGALPPVIGWAAARGELSREAWALFAIVFLWQLPHVLAIAWMYREDYARAGFPMLPVVEPDGRSTGRQAVLYAAALVPVSLAPAALHLAGVPYLAGALVLSLLFLGLAIKFARTRAVPDARRLFFASLLYLPLIWILMIVSRL